MTALSRRLVNVASRKSLEIQSDSTTKPRNLLERKFVWKLVFNCSNTPWKWNLGRIDSFAVWILVTSSENQQVNQNNNVTSLYWGYQAQDRHLAHTLSCVLESRDQNPLAFWSAGLWVRAWRVTWLFDHHLRFLQMASQILKKKKHLSVFHWQRIVCFLLFLIWCFVFIGPSGKLWSWLHCCSLFFPAISCPLCSNPSFELVWLCFNACWAVWMSY